MKKRKTNRTQDVTVPAAKALEYKGYAGSLEFSEVDAVFHGRILGIRDTVTFESRDARHLASAFRDAVDDYLATCKKIGKEPDKKFKGSFNVRIKPELHRKIHMRSRAMNISLNKFIEKIIEKAVR